MASWNDILRKSESPLHEWKLFILRNLNQYLHGCMIDWYYCEIPPGKLLFASFYENRRIWREIESHFGWEGFFLRTPSFWKGNLKGCRLAYQGTVFRWTRRWWGNGRWSTKAWQSTWRSHWLCLLFLVIVVIIILITSQVLEYAVAHLPMMPEWSNTKLALTEGGWSTRFH